MVVVEETELGHEPYPWEGSTKVFGLGATSIEANPAFLVGSIALFMAGSAMMMFGKSNTVIFAGDVVSFLGLIGGIASVRMV